jgi:hypothetical protein
VTWGVGGKNHVNEGCIKFIAVPLGSDLPTQFNRIKVSVATVKQKNAQASQVITLF